MAKIIDGKKLAEVVKDQIVADIIKINGQSAIPLKRPNLAIILIGERPDSKLYVELKEKEAVKIGIDTHLYKCGQDVSEQEVLEMIECLNKDDAIDAILVQLPLPTGLDTDKIIAAINPAKDVDGFHPANVKKLMASCEHAGFMPPLFQVILYILHSLDFSYENKKICVLANWPVFGKSLAHVLKCRGAEAEIVRADDKDLADKTSKADVLITAVGKPRYVKKEMIKKDAIIIDIGITKIDDKVYGDVDFNDVKDKVGYITPVPGGVGPLTIAMAFKNTLELYKKRFEK